MIRKLHRYLGLALVLFVVLTTVSGALLLWSNEYHQWRYPVLAGYAQAPLPDAKVLAVLSNASAYSISTIVMPSDGLPAYHAYRKDLTQAYYDARDGSLIAEWEPRGSLYSLLFEIHVHLLAGEPGHIAIGIVGLAMVLMVLSGMTVWWSRRRLFKLRRWIPRSTRSPRLMNAHAAQGALLGILVVMVALTGAAMVFHKQAEALVFGLLGSTQATRPEPVTITTSNAEGLADMPQAINWPAVLATTKERFPDATLRMASIPRAPDQPLTLRLKQPGELHSNGRSYLVVHPQTGASLLGIDATQAGLGPVIFNAFYPLHAGKTGWPAYRLVLLLVSLGLLYIAASGGWVYLRRRRKARGAVITQT